MQHFNKKPTKNKSCTRAAQSAARKSRWRYDAAQMISRVVWQIQALCCTMSAQSCRKKLRTMAAHDRHAGAITATGNISISGTRGKHGQEVAQRPAQTRTKP